jgi:hypothetical protein
MNTPLSESTWLTATPRQVSVTNAGEAIILDPVSNRYYSLTGVGERVWALLQEPVRLPDLRDAVVAAYAVSPEEAQRDVRDLLVQLLDAGLVEVREGP